MAGKLYSLPNLPYDYGALTPFISEQQLTFHHTKHHNAYVLGANALLEKFEKARKDGAEVDMKAAAKELSFHVGGYRLHNLFWENMAPAGKEGGGEPGGGLAKVLDSEFGSFARFKKEFGAAAAGVEGSGWAVLTYCKGTERPLIMQIEKHNTNVIPGFTILMVVDVWEHAYYLDYKNDRSKYLENFWNIVNWESVEKRLTAWLKN